MYKLLPQSSEKDTSSPLTAISDEVTPPPEATGEAIFAADSFWTLEAAFNRVDGVLRTAAGYYGGTFVKPSYKQVMEGSTGHTEAVKVTYDKRKVSYKCLLKVFFRSHDPTNKTYLNFSVNTHYRSAIFYANEEEKKQAQETKVQLQMKQSKRIVTKILPCSETISEYRFYLAESYHQKYYLQKYHIWLCESLGLRSSEHFADSHLASKLNGILSEENNKSNAAQELKMLVERYDNELPSQTKHVLEEIIQNLKSVEIRTLS